MPKQNNQLPQPSPHLTNILSLNSFLKTSYSSASFFATAGAPKKYLGVPTSPTSTSLHTRNPSNGRSKSPAI